MWWESVPGKEKKDYSPVNSPWTVVSLVVANNPPAASNVIPQSISTNFSSERLRGR